MIEARLIMAHTVIKKVDAETVTKAERYAKLVNYLANECPHEIRDGETAAETAIRWHKELTALREMRVQKSAAVAGGKGGKPQRDKSADDTEHELRTEWESRLEQCQELLDMLDDLPDRAADFAESVREKTQSIAEWIEENEHVTAAQCEALDNMQSGAERWLQ